MLKGEKLLLPVVGVVVVCVAAVEVAVVALLLVAVIVDGMAAVGAVDRGIFEGEFDEVHESEDEGHETDVIGDDDVDCVG